MLLEVGELTPGNETQEARALWDAVESESRRMHAPFDSAWFARVLEERGAPPAGLEAERTRVSPTLEVNATERYAVERREDLGEAPDVVNFVGRADELTLLRRWILNERARLVALPGMGGIGKISLAAQLAQDVAPGSEPPRTRIESLGVAPHQHWEIAFLADNPGVWMFYCHVLIHAAFGMVANVSYPGIDSPFEMGTRSGNRARIDVHEACS